MGPLPGAHPDFGLPAQSLWMLHPQRDPQTPPQCWDSSCTRWGFPQIPRMGWVGRDPKAPPSTGEMQAGQAMRGCSAVPAGSHRACHRPSVSQVGVGQSCGHSPCWALIWGRKFCRSARDLRWYSACTSISCGDTAPASPRCRGQGQPGGGWHLQFENSLHSRLLWPQNCTCQPRAGPVGAEHL